MHKSIFSCLCKIIPKNTQSKYRIPRKTEKYYINDIIISNIQQKLNSKYMNSSFSKRKLSGIFNVIFIIYIKICIVLHVWRLGRMFNIPPPSQHPNMFIIYRYMHQTWFLLYGRILLQPLYTSVKVNRCFANVCDFSSKTRPCITKI